MVWTSNSGLQRVCLALAAIMATCAASHAQPPKVDWFYTYEDSLDKAKEERKPVLLDFYADWCGPCRMMDSQVYADPVIVKALEGFVCVKMDVDKNEKQAFKYRVRGIPRAIVLNVHGDVIADQTGFVNSDEFLGFLTKAQALALKKIDDIDPAQLAGNTAPVPPEPVVKLDTLDLETLMEVLADKDKSKRKRARDEVIKRDSPQTRQALHKALNAPYLGTRIAAFETLRELSEIDVSQGVSPDAFPDDYDPWAGKESTQEALLD